MPTQDPLIATIDSAIALYPKAFPSLDDSPEEGSREFEAELALIQTEYVQLTCDAFLVLLQISGELFAHSRPAISNWTGLWYPSVEWRRIGL